MNGHGKDKDRDWSLAVAALPDGVRLELGLADLSGTPFTAILALDRSEARSLARALLAASGDAAERTFPRPSSTDRS